MTLRVYHQTPPAERMERSLDEDIERVTSVVSAVNDLEIMLLLNDGNCPAHKALSQRHPSQTTVLTIMNPGPRAASVAPGDIHPQLTLN